MTCAGTLPAEYSSFRYLKELWLADNLICGKSFQSGYVQGARSVVALGERLL